MSVQSDDDVSSSPSPSRSDSSSASPAGQTGGPSNGDPSHAADDLETLRGELAEIEHKADEYLRLAQRTQADFINFRRRVDEERAQQVRDASVAYVLRLLPILDDFERATASATPQDLESNWGKGIQLVERNLRGLLTAEDVQRIAAEGAEFDPHEHEALGSQRSSDVPEGHVLHIVRQGYRKGERVIRPAQVIVAAKA